MERYPIPQFIEAEGKIAFFISFRQFFYLLGAGVICFILYWILPRVLFYLISCIIFIAKAANIITQEVNHNRFTLTYFIKDFINPRLTWYDIYTKIATTSEICTDDHITF